MKNEFKEILTLLTRLNKKLPPKKNRSALIQLENRRIKDLILLDKKTIFSLNLLRKSQLLSIDEIMEQICYLNLYLNSYVWHIESISEIIEKLIPKDLKRD